MSKHFKNSLLLILLLLFSKTVSAQMVFGVNTGLGIKNAYVGYKTSGRFLPYFSIQGLNVKATNTYDGDKTTVSGSLIVPTLGTKFYLKENQKLKPYLDLAITKPINSIREDNENVLENKINLFGGSVGFGTEYFLDPQFSIGGEVGLMLLHAKTKISDDDFNGNSTEQNIKVGFNPTYAKISLNFYFNKSGK